MKKVLLILLAQIAMVNVSYAQEKERPVYELFEVTNMAAMTKQINTQMSQQMKAMIGQQMQAAGVPAGESEITEKYTAQMLNLVLGVVAWDKVKDKHAALYESVLTNEQIKKLTAFYKSDIGQITLSKMPELMQKSMMVGQQEVQTVMPQIQALMGQMGAELKAAQAKPSVK